MQDRLKARVQRCRVRFATFVLGAALMLSPQAARAWGIHGLLTKVAVDRLAPWERELIKAEESQLIRRYCIFPDVARDADAKPYLVQFPAEVKVSFHIPASLEQNKVLLDDKPAATTPRMTGAAPAQRIEVPLGNAATITLRCKSDGPVSRTHGVWAEPMLVR